jgi:hypothetical protein
VISPPISGVSGVTFMAVVVDIFPVSFLLPGARLGPLPSGVNRDGKSP